MDFNGVLVVGGALIVGFAGGAAAGFVGGALAGFFRHAEFAARLGALERKSEQAHLSGISGAGVAARQQKAERLQEALERAMELSSDEHFRGQDGKPDVVAVLKQVALEYPDVAADQVQKMMKGKMGALGRLFGG